MRIGDEGLHSGKVGALDDYGCIHHSPRMIVEIPSDHFAIFWPIVTGCSGGMNGDYSFAICLHEGKQVLLLAVIQIEFSIYVENHHIEEIQIAAFRLFGTASRIVTLAINCVLCEIVGICPDEHHHV